MSDLADLIDEYICTFDGVGDLTMDTLAMVIFAWGVCALFLLWLCKFIYNNYTQKGASHSVNGLPVDSTRFGISPSEKIRRSEIKDPSLSKDIKGLDIASKPSGKLGVSTTTPRKRLSRKSPGPELRKTLRMIPPPTNVVGPETTSVTWTSQIFRWLYSDLVIVHELMQSWVQAINEYTKKNLAENGIDIEVIRVLPESPPPNISNIFCNTNDDDPSNMTITLDCDSTPVFQIKTHRQKGGKMETSHYKLTISRLRARLLIRMSYNSLKGEMAVEGYPDIRIAMNSVGAIKPVDQDEKSLQDSISDILASSIRLCVYPIDFSIYATCPRAHESGRELSYDLDVMNNTPVQGVSSGRRLLVKVVRGEGLTHATDPYCIIEMDEPQQKNQTGARQGTNPYWDEHFLFEISPQSSEILFEIYDRNASGVDAQAKFLGLGLVGVDELSVGPSSSQILALQPRPYETDDVQGAITVEFVFIEGAEIPVGRRPYKIKEALKINNSAHLNGIQSGSDLADTAIRALEGGALAYNGNPSKSTLIIHSVQRVAQVEVNSGGKIHSEETLSDSNKNGVGYADITANITHGTSDEAKSTMNTSTGGPQSDLMAIHLNNKINNNNNTTANAVDKKDNSNSAILNVITPNIADPYTTCTGAKFGVPNNGTIVDNKHLSNHNSDAVNSPGKPIAQSSPTQTNHIECQDGNGTPNGNQANDGIKETDALDNDAFDRGGSRRKRDFFGTLRRRLGRSKTRGKSLERSGAVPLNAENTTDSNTLCNNIGGGITSNTATDPNVAAPLLLDQSRRSSLSESSAISAFSSASARTFLHEESTLVLETMENGVKRHFLVPLSIAQRPRWRRKGTKLHIYNDHTFLAKHLSGSLLCDVCNRSIPRRPGKQGYACRDCQMKCHKQCHVRVPQACSNPTALSMELSKISNPAAVRSMRQT